MRFFAELEKGRGVVLRLVVEPYKGHERVDLREWEEPRHGGADLIPTRKGINVPASALPALRAALEDAEAAALAAGLLRPDDYSGADLPLPPALRP